MDKEDKDFLHDLFLVYTPQTIMKELMVAAQNAADDLSDTGMKDQAKQVSLMVQTLEDITSGRPFLV